MKEVFLNNSFNLITKYNTHYSKEDKEKLMYGLEGIYLMITKLIFIFLLSIILKCTKEMIVILLLFNLIRFFAFGFHAEKSSHCLIFSTIMFIAIPLLILNLKPSLITRFIISIICSTTILAFAPADTKKRPLPNKKKRIIRKTISTIIAIIYTIATLVLKNNFKYLFLSASIIQAINVNPITYKIFKQPFNNYKNYLKD